MSASSVTSHRIAPRGAMRSWPCDATRRGVGHSSEEAVVGGGVPIDFDFINNRCNRDANSRLLAAPIVFILLLKISLNLHGR